MSGANPLDYRFISPHTDTMRDVFIDPFFSGFGNMLREVR